MSQSEAPRTGADLKAARESLGWDLNEVASGLRIRRPFLEALEEGRTSDLPGPAYAIGFVKAYANALGLDADEMARRFRAEAGEVIDRKTHLVFPEPVPERGVPAGAVVLIALVLGIGGYIGWHRYSASTDTVAEAVPPVPARLDTAATRPRAPEASAPVAGVPATPAPDAHTTPATPGAPSATVAVTPVPGAPPAAGTPTAPQVEPVPPIIAATPFAPPPVVVIPTPAIPPSSAAAAVPPPAAAAERVVIRARSDAWINVRDRAGQVLLNRVLRAGESWTAPVADLASLSMTTGNAGGTEIVLDGTPTAALGGNGVVRRDIPLDPDRLRDMPAPPAPRPAAPSQPQ